MTQREESTYIEDARALQAYLPHKPYCSNDVKKGLLIRPLKSALKHKYIELNPPHMQRFFTIDIDYRVDFADFATEDFNLPQPIFCVANRRNYHVHLIYGLNSPVYTTSMAHLAPLQYLKAIIDAYCEVLGADPMYSGLISKNPWVDKWRVFQVGYQLYSLEYLARWVDLTRKPVKTIEGLGIGRNCDIFAKVRNWSYSAIRDYWDKDLTSWFEAVKFKCLQENAKFTQPLGESEINQIAKSIAKWTRQRMTPENFSEWSRKEVNRRWSHESKKSQGIEMLASGRTIDEVMQELDICRATVYNWLKEAKPDEVKKTLTESRPWADLGVSRSWYFELKKRG